MIKKYHSFAHDGCSQKKRKRNGKHQWTGSSTDKVHNCLLKMPNRKIYSSLHTHSQGKLGNKKNKNKTKDKTQGITTLKKHIYTQMAVGWFPAILL